MKLSPETLLRECQDMAFTIRILSQRIIELETEIDMLRPAAEEKTDSTSAR